MPHIINVGKENSAEIGLHYDDFGKGRPVVLIHGWPLSARSWEKQVPVLLDAGYRVIAYDRRGFGESSKPSAGYDYDTMAADLHKIVTQLDLRDVTLVGFSMGGGEVARYFGAFGAERINQAVFISAITPFLLKTPDNPEGADGSIFEEIKKAISADRLAFLTKFFADFYNVDVLKGTKISQEMIDFSWNIASIASFKATLDCVSSWLTDFRKDLAGIRVPTMVIHGDSDRIVPFAASGKRMQGIVRGSRIALIKGGPHGLNWTHSDEVNRELLAFLGKAAVSSRGVA